MHSIPEGWTDDMRIDLPPSCTIDEIVDLVIANALQGISDEQSEEHLVRAFGLSAEDAALARDRTFGGIFRAATGNPLNYPSQEKDPIAWMGLIRAQKDPTIIKRIYPSS